MSGLHLKVLETESVKVVKDEYNFVHMDENLKGNNFLLVSIEEYEKENKKIEDNYKKSKDAATQEYNRTYNSNKEKALEIWDINLKRITERREKEIKKLSEKYKEVQWIWQLSPKNPLGDNMTANGTISKGFPDDRDRKQFSFPTFLVGGGFVYLEAFFPNDKPKKRAPYGIFVRCLGKASIIRTEWTDLRDNPINGAVKPGSIVRLHIYTRGLYGQDIDVVLSHKFIYKPCEVNVYNVNHNEDGMSGVSGFLNSGDKSETYLQKATLDICILKEEFGNNTDLVVDKVYSNNRKNEVLKIKGFENKILEIRENGHLYERPQGVKPVVINSVETDYRSFHPCRYESITLSEEGNEGRHVYYDRDYKNKSFELVAGNKKNSKEITIILDKLDTSECTLTPKHKGYIIYSNNDKENNHPIFSITKYPEENVNNYIGEKEKIVDFSSSVGRSIGKIIKIKEEIDAIPKLKIIEFSNKKLIFEARYIYNTSPIGNMLHYIFRYFWPGESVKPCQYIIQASTCAYQQKIQISTYPDVIWSFKLSYSNTKQERELISNQTYKNKKFKRPKQKWEKIGDKHIGIALGATWDTEENPNKNVMEDDDDKTNFYNATVDITEKVHTFIDKLGVVGDFVNKVFLGKENKDNSTYEKASEENEKVLKKFHRSPEEIKKEEERQNKEKLKQKKLLEDAIVRYDNATNEKEKEKIKKEIKNLQKRGDKNETNINRSVVGIEIQQPQIEIELCWYRENIKQKGTYYNQTGIVLEGALEFNPLIGIEATLDFLALAQRAHPVALAVIAVADITMDLIGDGSKITCELSANGSFGGRIQGFLNTKTKENSFNKIDRNINNKELIGLKCDLEFKLKIAINIKIKKKVFFIKVVLTGEFGAEATAKWSGSSPLNTDDKGLYIEPELTFEGLEIEGYANFEGKAGGDKDDFFSVSSNNNVKWQAIDAWEKPKSWGRFYIPSKKEL
ncbi:hypothetical protein [Capnocytophaga sputigena]|uniref:hypothetical protein n=1 Tax=Capnocytophaga sputigena TaxID=1019 RepID=UPI0028F01332|nr:hypothetical protein [Capnocytophaga sputigena]